VASCGRDRETLETEFKPFSLDNKKDFASVKQHQDKFRPSTHIIKKIRKVIKI